MKQDNLDTRLFVPEREYSTNIKLKVLYRKSTKDILKKSGIFSKILENYLILRGGAYRNIFLSISKFWAHIKIRKNPGQFSIDDGCWITHVV